MARVGPIIVRDFSNLIVMYTYAVYYICFLNECGGKQTWRTWTSDMYMGEIGLNPVVWEA